MLGGSGASAPRRAGVEHLARRKPKTTVRGAAMAILVTTEDHTSDEPEHRPRAATAVRPPTQVAASARWSKAYARALVVSDTSVVVVTLVLSTLIGSQPYTLPLLHGTGDVS